MSGLLTPVIGKQTFRDVFGGGKNISLLNPLQMGRNAVRIDGVSITGEFTRFFNPKLIRAFNNDILCFYEKGKGGEESATLNTGKIMMSRSSDEGLTWGTPVIVAEDATPYWCYGACPFALGTSPGMRILLFYGKGDAGQTGAARCKGRFLKYSDDQGFNWSSEINCVDIGIPAGTAPVQDLMKMVRSDKYWGRKVLYAASGCGAEGSEWTKINLYQSADGGISGYALKATIFNEPSHNGLCEPALFRIGGRLFCIARFDVSPGGVVTAYSDNNGETWSRMIGPVLSETFGNFCPAIIDLGYGVAMAGRGYCANNPYTATGLFFSPDGLFWFLMKGFLGMPPGAADGYWSGLAIPNGRILITYGFYLEGAGGSDQDSVGLGGVYALTMVEEDFYRTPLEVAGCDILSLATLAGGTTSALADCEAIPVKFGSRVALTVKETYHASAAAGGKLHLYSSPDNQNWDTEVIETAKTLGFDASHTQLTFRETFTPGDAAQRVRFLKCRYENADTLADYLIEDCEDAWNEQAVTGVASELDTSDYKVGSGSAKLTMTADAGIGVLASEVVSLVGNTLDDYDQFILWIKSSIDVAANQLQILLDDTANCASPVATINIPALRAGEWTQCLPAANFSGCTALTIISVGVKQVSDLGAFILWLDDLRATRRATGIRVTATLGG